MSTIPDYGGPTAMAAPTSTISGSRSTAAVVQSSTEPQFYELADEYGLMGWNDFWESTENCNAEA